jgi:hypothetical protein
MDPPSVEDLSVRSSTEPEGSPERRKELSDDTCPHCRQIIKNRRSLPNPDVSRLHPTTIPNTHTTIEEWKKATDEAIKLRLESRYNDEVKVLLLTWKANDIGSKSPDAGSLVLDETIELQRVFKEIYGYQTELFEIPSDSPQMELQTLLSKILLDLDKERLKKKRPLLIIYYNGHGSRSKDPRYLDHLMFAA